MILTMQQMKWLKKKPNGEKQYYFIGQENATKAEREELKEIDSAFYDIYGFHMIVNIDEV